MCVLLPTAALLSFAGGAGLPEPAPAQAWIDLEPPRTATCWLMSNTPC